MRRLAVAEVSKALTVLYRLAKHPGLLEAVADEVESLQRSSGDGIYKDYWSAILQAVNRACPESEGFDVIGLPKFAP